MYSIANVWQMYIGTIQMGKTHGLWEKLQIFVHVLNIWSFIRLMPGFNQMFATCFYEIGFAKGKILNSQLHLLFRCLFTALVSLVTYTRKITCHDMSLFFQRETIMLQASKPFYINYYGKIWDNMKIFLSYKDLKNNCRDVIELNDKI